MNRLFSSLQLILQVGSSSLKYHILFNCVMPNLMGTWVWFNPFLYRFVQIQGNCRKTFQSSLNACWDQASATYGIFFSGWLLLWSNPCYCLNLLPTFATSSWYSKAHFEPLVNRSVKLFKTSPIRYSLMHVSGGNYLNADFDSGFDQACRGC